MGRIRRTVFAASVLAIGYAACPADKDTWDGCVDRTFDAAEGWLEDDSNPQWPGGPAGEQVASAETPTPGAQSPERERSTPAPVDQARTETRRTIGTDTDAIAALGSVRRRDVRQGDPVAQGADMEGRGELMRIEEGIENAIAGGRAEALVRLNYQLIAAFDAPGKVSGELRQVMSRTYRSQTAMLMDQYGLPHPVRQRGAFIRALQSNEGRAASLLDLIGVQSALASRLENGQANAWDKILKDVYGIGEDS